MVLIMMRMTSQVFGMSKQTAFRLATQKQLCSRNGISLFHCQFLGAVYELI